MNERSAEWKLSGKRSIFTLMVFCSGNIETLRKAFHPKAMMYGVRSKAVSIVEIEGLYAGFSK